MDSSKLLFSVARVTSPCTDVCEKAQKIYIYFIQMTKNKLVSMFYVLVGLGLGTLLLNLTKQF